MTTNLKALMSAAGAVVMGLALFLFVPANPDLRGLSDARFTQDDSRDPHSSRFAQANPDTRDTEKARFAQDDVRDPHTTRFAYARVDVRDPASAQGDNWDPHNSRFVVGVVW